MTELRDEFDERELCRIAAFHVWEAAKRLASVRSRAGSVELRAQLDECCEALRVSHRALAAIGAALAPPARLPPRK
ncbi:MAG: hypothetical protein ABI629_23960 [bacterium]